MLTPEQQKLAEDNIRLCHEFVRRELRRGPSLTRYGMDKDDMLSIAHYSLCLAARDYDPGLGYTFSTLFWRICWRQYRRAIRDLQTDKRRAVLECISLNSPCRSAEDQVMMNVLMDEGPLTDEWYIERERRIYVRFLVDKLLAPDQRRIVRRYYWDKAPQPKIAAELGMSQSMVSRALSKAAVRIRGVMKAAGYDY